MDRQVSMWTGAVSWPAHTSSHTPDWFPVTPCGDLQAACACFETISISRGELHSREINLVQSWDEGPQENKSLIFPRAKRRRFFRSFVWETHPQVRGSLNVWNATTTLCMYSMVGAGSSHGWENVRNWVSSCPCLSFHGIHSLVKTSRASVSWDSKATLSFLRQGHLYQDLCSAFEEIGLNQMTSLRRFCPQQLTEHQPRHSVSAAEHKTGALDSGRGNEKKLTKVKFQLAIQMNQSFRLFVKILSLNF